MLEPVFGVVLVASAYLGLLFVYLLVKNSEIVQQLLAFERMMALAWCLPLTSPQRTAEDASASHGRPFFHSSRWFP